MNAEAADQQGKIPARLLSRLLVTALLCSMVGTRCARNAQEDLKATLASVPRPAAVDEFAALPHFDPINQDSTLACWSFATLSFIESEMQRLGRQPVRLSRTYPVYCIFLEKIKRFVSTKGESRVSPGDLFPGVLKVIELSGALPEEVYSGRVHGVYNHVQLYADLRALVEQIREDSLWNEAAALSKARAVQNRHLGEPPAEFPYGGRKYTPRSFAASIVRLPWREYLMVTSFRSAPYNTYTELQVPDNWAHDTLYFNVPLDDFYEGIRGAVERGYSVAIDADVSELSYRTTKQYGIIPEADLASDSSDAALRERWFEDGSTTDDHLMHIVGYRRMGEHDWFLVKDSWRTAFEGPLGGYVFFHESYVRFKVLAYLVHRDAVPAIMPRTTSPL
jgi:bleomycin hydrolase